MALCTSCGNQVEESASFCTSCGRRMPAGAQPSAAVTVKQSVCLSCGAQADPDFSFCTNCGQRIAAQTIAEASPAQTTFEPDPVAAVAPLPMAVDASPIPAAPTRSSSSTICASCGTKLEPGTSFCTRCGQPTAGSSAVASEPVTSVAPAAQALEATPPASAEPVITPPASAEPTITPVAAEPVAAAPVPAPHVAAPVYATPSEYQPAKPGGGAFRMIVLVLLLLVVVGGCGGWYFMGVETVIVSSPPDVTVFLDDKELAPTSYGRYVIPHLSRQSHLLRVQRPGFADTIQRLDFPLTSLHEWVNIKLVPRRQVQSPPR